MKSILPQIIQHWIGGGSIIMPGVTIGDNVTIGAGSVVTKSLTHNDLAYGNPCRVYSAVYIIYYQWYNTSLTQVYDIINVVGKRRLLYAQYFDSREDEQARGNSI